MRLALFTIIFFTSSVLYSQADYKQMMNDMQVNFYDVVSEAERHFESHDKGKGSGWKGYQRWKAENEVNIIPQAIEVRLIHTLQQMPISILLKRILPRRIHLMDNGMISVLTMQIQ